MGNTQTIESNGGQPFIVPRGCSATCSCRYSERCVYLYRSRNGRDGDSFSRGLLFYGNVPLAGKPDHTEPSVLYSLIIAQPSERKSPVMHMVKAPFNSYERQFVEADNIKGDNPLRIAVDNVTPEALVYAFADNGTIMMISDEAGMLNNFNGKYSNVPNVDMFLKAWNGEAYIYDRATKG